MTRKTQNNAIYGSNNLIIVLHLGESLKDAFMGGAKVPLSHRQWLLRPVLKTLVLESNEVIFFVLFHFYIRIDK